MMLWSEFFNGRREWGLTIGLGKKTKYKGGG